MRSRRMAITLKDVHMDLQEHKDRDNEFHDTVHGMFSTIKDNHLAHIQASTTKLETNYEWMRWLLMVMVGLFTTTIGLLIKFAFFE